MAKVLTDSKHYTDIAKAIREAGPLVDETFKPEEMASRITMSISHNRDNAGRDGYFLGKENGIAEGKQAEYDRFWDAYQKNGTRSDYVAAFARGWNDEIFQPKYDIVPTGFYATQMFQYSEITDLKDKLDALGVTLDTSSADGFTQMFQGAAITHIPTIDMRKATTAGYTFGTSCKAITIDKLIVSETTAFQDNTFIQANWLQNITFEGTIGKSINFQWSPLTRTSIESVMAALSKNSNDLTATFKKTAVEAAFTTQEWNDLTATRTNWNIALV